MNRNSPVPLWAVLSVGILLVGGVYVLAQKAAAPPRASAILSYPMVSPSISPTVSVSPPNAPTSVVQSATAETTVPASDRYGAIVELGAQGMASQLNIPGKYQCRAYSITKPEIVSSQPYDPSLAYPPDIFLEPSGKFLLHLSEPAGYGPQYEATFSKDCHHLYYFDVHAQDNQLHTLDVSSGTPSMLTIPISSFPSALVIPPKYTPYYPSLQFIYAIDDNHLLLWFRNPVSGPDYSVNDTSQAIYDIAAKTLTFVSQGDMDPTSEDKSGIALLNYQSNTLIVLGAANAQGLVTTRTEIDLATGRKTTSTLKQPGDPVESGASAHSCDYAGFDTQGTQAGYVTCRNNWLRQLLGY